MTHMHDDTADTPDTPAASVPAQAARGRLAPVVRNARYEDIARRLLQGQKASEIAPAHNLSTRRIEQILRDQEFATIYARVADELWRDVDSIIRNEKVSHAIRQNALAARGMTLLADIIDDIDDHVRTAERTSASKLDVGVKAARAAIEPTRDRGSARSDDNRVQINVAVGAPQADIISKTAVEAGVPMDDVPVPAGLRPVREDPAHEEEHQP